MSRARVLLVLAMVSSATACLVTQSLDGLTGGGGDGGAADVTMGDAPPDTMTTDGAADAAADTAPDVNDSGAATDASDGGPSRDVAQPDVVTTGPVSCADAGVLLCEDFENGLDTNKWPVTTNDNATETIDGTQHHRGAYALHLNVPALTTDGSLVDVAGNIRHYVTTPLPSPLFVRAFVMFSSAQPQGTEAFFVAQQSASPYDGLQLEINQQNGDYAVTDWTAPSLYTSSTVPAAAATWTCIEWELDPPATGTTTTNSDVWINGAEVSSLHLASTPISDLETLGFGVGFYQESTLPEFDEWIDDIYVDTSRVGCDK